MSVARRKPATLAMLHTVCCGSPGSGPRSCAVTMSQRLTVHCSSCLLQYIRVQHVKNHHKNHTPHCAVCSICLVERSPMKQYVGATGDTSDMEHTTRCFCLPGGALALHVCWHPGGLHVGAVLQDVEGRGRPRVICRCVIHLHAA